MKKTERVAAPAVGNAIGLFVGLWAIDKYEWLPSDQQETIVIALGTIFIHLLIQVRSITAWIASKMSKEADSANDS